MNSMILYEGNAKNVCGNCDKSNIYIIQNDNMQIYDINSRKQKAKLKLAENYTKLNNRGVCNFYLREDSILIASEEDPGILTVSKDTGAVLCNDSFNINGFEKYRSFPVCEEEFFYISVHGNILARVTSDKRVIINENLKKDLNLMFNDNVTLNKILTYRYAVNDEYLFLAAQTDKGVYIPFIEKKSLSLKGILDIVLGTCYGMYYKNDFLWLSAVYSGEAYIIRYDLKKCQVDKRWKHEIRGNRAICFFNYLDVMYCISDEGILKIDEESNSLKKVYVTEVGTIFLGMNNELMQAVFCNKGMLCLIDLRSFRLVSEMRGDMVNDLRSWLSNLYN